MRILSDVSETEQSSPEPVVVGPGDAAGRILGKVATLAIAAEQPIVVRTALTLRDPSSGQYISWPDQTWRVQVKDAAEAKQLRQGIELLFDLVGLFGVEAAVTDLQRLKDARL